MKKVLKAIDSLSIATGWCGNAVVIAMAVYMCLNFLLRKLFNFSFNGGFEVVQFMLLIVIFTSFTITNTYKRHVCLSLLITKLPKVLRYSFNGIICLLEAAIAAVISYGMFSQGQYAMKTAMVSTTLRIPFYPFYYVCGVFAAIFALSLASDIIRSFMAAFGDEDSQNYISQGWA